MLEFEYLALVQDVLDTMTLDDLKSFVLVRARTEHETDRSFFLRALRACSKKLQTSGQTAWTDQEAIKSLREEVQAMIDCWNERDPETLAVRFELNEKYGLEDWDDWEDPESTEMFIHDPNNLGQNLGTFVYLIERSLILGQTDLAEKLASALCTTEIHDPGEYISPRKIFSEMESNNFAPMIGFEDSIKEVCRLILQQTEISAKDRIRRVVPLLICLPDYNGVISSYADNLDYPAEDRDDILMALLEATGEEPYDKVFDDNSYLVQTYCETALSSLSDQKKKAEVMLRFLPSFPGLFSYYFKDKTEPWDPAEEAPLIENCLKYLKDPEDIKLAYYLLDTLYTECCFSDEAAAARYAFAYRPGFNTYAKYARLNPERMDPEQFDLILSGFSPVHRTVFQFLEGDEEEYFAAMDLLCEEPLDSLPLTVLLLAYLYDPREGREYPEYLDGLLNRRLVNPLKWLEYKLYDDEDLEAYDYSPDDESASIYPLLERMRSHIPVTMDRRESLVDRIYDQLRYICSMQLFDSDMEKLFETSKYVAALEYVSQTLPRKSDRVRAESLAGKLIKQDHVFRKSLEAWRSENRS